MPGRATRVTHPHNNPGNSIPAFINEGQEVDAEACPRTRAGVSLIGPPEFPGLGLISWVHWSLDVGNQAYWSTELCFPTFARGGHGLLAGPRVQGATDNKGDRQV